MRSVRTILLLLIPVFLITCSSSDTDNKAVAPDVTISLSEPAEPTPLNDDMSLLGSLRNIKRIDEDRFILMDGSPAVYLFEDHIMTASYGSVGKGPCEFEGISSMDVRGDQLYLLDRGQTKIITFDIETQECVGEFINPALRGNSYLYKEEGTPAFITAFTSYIFPTPDSVSLYQRVYSNGESEPIDFTLGQTNNVKSWVSVSGASLNFEMHNGLLYTYFPLTDSLFALNPTTNVVTSFPLQIDLKREEFDAAGQDIQQVLEVIQSDFQFINRFFVTDDFVFVHTTQQATEEGEQPTKTLQVYTMDGTLIDEIPFNNEIYNIDGDTIYELVENQDPNAQYTYAVTTRQLIIE